MYKVSWSTRYTHQSQTFDALMDAYDWFHRLVFVHSLSLLSVHLFDGNSETVAQWDAGNGESISVNHPDGDRVRALTRRQPRG